MAGLGLQPRAEFEVFVEPIAHRDRALAHGHVSQPGDFSGRGDIGRAVEDRGREGHCGPAAPPSFIRRQGIPDQSLLRFIHVFRNSGSVGSTQADTLRQCGVEDLSECWT